MQRPFALLFMNCAGRAHCVLEPVNDDADFLQMQHISIIFQMVLFFKQKIPLRKSFEHITYFNLNL
jgi:hypothetical protein